MFKEILRASLEASVPEFVKMCEDERADAVLVNQDSFAPTFSETELMLLGLCVKYAGICGKNITFIPTKIEIKQPVKPAEFEIIRITFKPSMLMKITTVQDHVDGEIELYDGAFEDKTLVATLRADISKEELDSIFSDPKMYGSLKFHTGITARFKKGNKLNFIYV